MPLVLCFKSHKLVDGLDLGISLIGHLQGELISDIAVRVYCGLAALRGVRKKGRKWLYPQAESEGEES